MKQTSSDAPAAKQWAALESRSPKVRADAIIAIYSRMFGHFQKVHVELKPHLAKLPSAQRKRVMKEVEQFMADRLAEGAGFTVYKREDYESAKGTKR